MLTVYGKENCPACEKTKNLLQINNIPFSYIDVFKDDQAMEFIKGNGYRTVPQIFQDGKNIGDYNDLVKFLI